VAPEVWAVSAVQVGQLAPEVLAVRGGRAVLGA
jgi:hypothetical protein